MNYARASLPIHCSSYVIEKSNSHEEHMNTALLLTCPRTNDRTNMQDDVRKQILQIKILCRNFWCTQRKTAKLQVSNDLLEFSRCQNFRRCFSSSWQFTSSWGLSCSVVCEPPSRTCQKIYQNFRGLFDANQMTPTCDNIDTMLQKTSLCWSNSGKASPTTSKTDWKYSRFRPSGSL